MRTVIYVVVALVVLVGWWTPAVGQSLASGPSAAARSEFSPPRTPWGDPDIQGTYTNADENGTPMEQPAELAGKRLEDFGEKEMAALRIDRQTRAKAGAARIGGTQEEDTGAGPSHWYEHLAAENAQPWLVFDPPSGKIPALSAAARQRQAARQAGRKGRGPADSWTDPAASRRKVDELQKSGKSAEWIGIDGAGHFMLRRAATWHRLVADAIAGMSRGVAATKMGERR